jgi:ergothioneine biosynthesis protein EgtB
MTPTTTAPVDAQTSTKPEVVSSNPSAASLEDNLFEEFCSVRGQSLALCAPLTAEDMMVQSCAEASPAKWHVAHTTWFFETFILREFLPDYREYHPDFLWLLNSYYNAISDHPEKKLRASFSRPGLEAVLEYRQHVEAAIERLFEAGIPVEAQERLILGLNHEQQHTELLATDIKHAFWTNPLHPAYREEALPPSPAAPEMKWVEYPGGLVELGHAGDGFAFDNELPRHKEFLEPFQLASRPVTCAEFLDFMNCGGYERPELWLSEGWDTVQAQSWRAPLYWHRDSSGEWSVFTLRGRLPMNELASTPVCSVSYYEADAFANWAGKRLPTEAEWEIAAAHLPVRGNLLESGRLHPAVCENSRVDGVNRNQSDSQPHQMFGDVWEWTRSPYIGYPGYRPMAGALGEYNGKFMSNQMVLRGGSIATPASHIRASYRNFFPSATRWQFSGIRLANRD